jgi:hypothetical protein
MALGLMVAVMGCGAALAVTLQTMPDLDEVRSSTVFVNLYLFVVQDTIWLVAGLAILLLSWIGSRWPSIPTRPPEGLGPGAVTAAIVLAFVATAALGVSLVYREYALSMDEFVSRFHAAALARGELFPRLPAEWHELAPALQPMFMSFWPSAGVWVPMYLPGNAAVLAAFEKLGLMPWTHVVTSGVALLGLARLTHRIWPQHRWAPAAAVLLLASSPQMWVTSLTSYAMTPHLLLTIAWVAFYLRDDTPGHAAALLIAPLAIGLHQIYVHPIVVAPFVFWLVTDRRWKIVAVYGAWYAVWIFFWTRWPEIVALHRPDALSSPLQSPLDKAVMLFSSRHSVADLLLWPANMARFASWQNLAGVFLALAGLFSIREAPRPVKASVWSAILLLGVHVLLMPTQGHGWGYRYLHPVLGLLALVAIYGGIRLASRPLTGEAARFRRFVVLAGALSLVALPLRAVQVERFVRPYALASHLIDETTAPVVIIADPEIWFGGDLVRNDLSRPTRILAASRLSDSVLAGICDRFPVQVIGPDELARFGIRSTAPAMPRGTTLEARAAAAGCSASQETSTDLSRVTANPASGFP